MKRNEDEANWNYNQKIFGRKQMNKNKLCNWTCWLCYSICHSILSLGFFFSVFCFILCIKNSIFYSGSLNLDILWAKYTYSHVVWLWMIIVSIRCTSFCDEVCGVYISKTLLLVFIYIRNIYLISCLLLNLHYTCWY